ncbi:MAG: histidine triad nucleotide-binding protein [Bacillota bacterium]|nr:histidine triad nucleotide-binding protein [Bacillota bacterium]
MECIFCRIAAGQIGSDKVYEDDDIFAFRDITPKAPVHVLIIPKRHYASILETGEDDKIVCGMIAAASRIAGELGVDKDGFRIVVNTGRNGGQSVDHLHLHLLGGRAMGWPPG